MCGVRKQSFTPSEKKFLTIYLKTLDSLKALNEAYPKSINWSKDAQFAQVGKILRRPRIDLAIKAHNEREAEALKNSTLLNKHKILQEIVRQYSETSEAGAAERSNSVNLLKLMAQISKLLDNSTTINNNIQVNNQSINQISDFLDL